MVVIDGGITAAKGFMAASCNVRIKDNDKNDMALVYSEKPCVAAGMFTQNKVKAAPVKWDSRIIEEAPFIQAVVVNTGIANACTGSKGLENCLEIAAETGEMLGLAADNVCVCSTGVIGPQLPMDKILKGISILPGELRETSESGTKAAEAIMTTDTVSKEFAVNVDIGGKTVTVGGMCKGAGMIHPNMATMLCFITTDAMIKKELLQKMFRDIIDDTLNMVSVDGDTSTNDTAIVLANGMAENDLIDAEDDRYASLAQAMETVAAELTKKIAGDGEGCTCLFEAEVKNAKTKRDAKILAKSVITSNLTKAAIFGHDANWGRILCALGYSDGDFDPDKVDLTFESDAGSIEIMKDGNAVEYSEEKATKILSGNPVRAVIDVKDGKFSATAWGCDLTLDYVRINADYRS